MGIVTEYFKNKSDKLSFFELKENTSYSIKGYPINKNIPLPIKTDSLIKEIKEGNLEEEIKLSHIIDGIIYLIGIDLDFPNIEDYIKILINGNEAIEDYIFYEGIRYIEKNDYDNACIYFRTLKAINNKNINGLFNYSLGLEEIAKHHFSLEKEEEGLAFLRASTKELESILDIDDKYPLAYYKLGYHYKFFGQFLKAKLIWTKHLTLEKDDLRLQEIRTEIDLIEDDVTLESGLSYLHHEQYGNALDLFLKLLPKFNDWWELNYFIGLSYKGLGNYNKAVDYFRTALELNKEESDIYNELGITLFNLGDILGAIDIFTEGINAISNDYKLIFNRGLGYLQISKFEESYEDISRAVALNPKDVNMLKQKEALEKLLYNN